jgi:hypothetical protein
MPQNGSAYADTRNMNTVHHRGRPDQAIHRKWQQPGSQAMLAVRADEFIGMLV